MKWKKQLEKTSIVLLFLFTFSSLVYGVWEIDALWIIDPRWVLDVEAAPTYTDDSMGADGNVLMKGGIQLKPNDLHTYIPQYDGNVQNITLNDGVLTLSKSLYAYNIYCSTNDNVTTHLRRWFFMDVTRFIAYTETDATVDYQVNGRNKGEPRGVVGSDIWSFDADTSIVSLTASNNTEISILWYDTGTQQLIWYLDRIPMWLGISGFVCLMLSPAMFVIYSKKDDLPMAFIFALGLFILGLGLVVGWLWG